MPTTGVPKAGPLPAALWLAPAVLLCGALAPLPYGYYTFLRLATCGAAVFLAWTEYDRGRSVTPWLIALAGVALLFNPIVPVHLNRHVWMYLNIGTASLFVLHMVVSRSRTV